MATVYMLTGRITAAGGLELDEPPPLPPGRVRVSVEALDRDGSAPTGSLPQESKEEWARRRALMDEAIGCLSDEDAKRILDVLDEDVRAAGFGAAHRWPLSDEEIERRRKEVVALAGSVNDEEAQAVLEAMERDCERIDPADWR